MTNHIPAELLASSGVYIIRNSINAKVYVGSAVNFKKRFGEHFNSLKRLKHHSKHLQQFTNKYGTETLRFELLATCEPAALLTIEQTFIVMYSAAKRAHGFNICPVAGSALGTVKSAETRAKISAARKGQPMSATTMEVLRAINTGRRRTDAEKLAISLANTGVKKSAEEIAQRTATRLANAALRPPSKMPPGFGATVSQRNTGRKASESTREKIAQSKRGKPMHENTRKAIAAAQAAKRLETIKRASANAI